MTPQTEYAGKSYDEIWKIFSAKFGDNPATRSAHQKWKEIGAQVRTGK